MGDDVAEGWWGGDGPRGCSLGTILSLKSCGTVETGTGVQEKALFGSQGIATVANVAEDLVGHVVVFAPLGNKFV